MARKAKKSCETEKDSFATNLREIMKDECLTQTELTNRIEEISGARIQRQTISNYVSGQSKPDTEKLTWICNAVDVSSDYLLGLSKHKRINSDSRIACETTGLSEDAISEIIKLNSAQLHALDTLLQSEAFKSFLKSISVCASYMGKQGNIIKANMVSKINNLDSKNDPYELHKILRPIIEAGGDLYPMYRAKAIEEAELAFASAVDNLKGD